MWDDVILIEGDFEDIIESFRSLKYMSPTAWRVSLSEKKVNWFKAYRDDILPPFAVIINDRLYKEGRKEEIVIYEGIDNEIELKIINSSNEKLTISNIIQNPPFCTDELPIDFPKELPEGKDVVLKLKMDPVAMTGEKMESVITIYYEEKFFGTIEFLFEKEVAQEFAGYLAFNIGSTNAIIAYKTSDQTDFVPVEKNANKEKSIFSPSVIRFENVVDGKPKKYVIGHKAKGLMILDPKSSVASIINHLGRKEKIRIFPVDESCGLVDFYPVEVLTHFIVRLREECEKFFKKKVNQAVITYPSGFTHIQIEELKGAFRNSGIEIMDTISEPEAIAINYVVEERDTVSNSYIIGIFDCGLGRTNLTMLEVLEKRKNKQRILDVNVLATDGYHNFGGSNLTEIMMEIMVEKINKKQIQIFSEDLNTEELKLFYKVEDEINEEMIKVMIPKGINWEKIVRVNRNYLWTRAEECKIQLSDIETSEIDMSIGLQMVNAKDELEPVEVLFNVKKQEFENRIHDKILELVEKFKRMSKKTGRDFDLILLYGMSSHIPLLHQVLLENFNNTIKFARDLKKSAVLGALRYCELRMIPGLLELKLDELKKLRSTIGLIMRTSGGIKKFFEVFPEGTILPTQPVKINLPLKRRMLIVVYINNGTHEYIDEAPDEFEFREKIDIIIPDEINDKQIKDVELYMHVNEELKPRFSIRSGDFYKEYA